MAGTRQLLAAFAAQEGPALEHYKRFVGAGKNQPSPWEQLRNQAFLGSDGFADSMRRQVPKDSDLREIPQAQARPPARPLAEYDSQHRERDAAISAAFASGSYTLQEIGDYFGLHYSRVSKIVRAKRQLPAIGT